jgi:hypothetical protein
MVTRLVRLGVIIQPSAILSNSAARTTIIANSAVTRAHERAGDWFRFGASFAFELKCACEGGQRMRAEVDTIFRFEKEDEEKSQAGLADHSTNSQSKR